MSLRTRIAVTFLVLLAAVLAAALGAVSVTNQLGAEREVQRQLTVGSSVFSRLLESDRRQLTQAAQAVAADYGFREAVAARDTDTLASALQNSGERIGAAMVVLTSLDGHVIAASGIRAEAGAPFPIMQRAIEAGETTDNVMVDNGHVYQLVSVAVRSPLPVAYIAMGFEINEAVARQLSDVTGLGVTLAVKSQHGARDLLSTLPAAGRGGDVETQQISLSSANGTEVVAILSRSLADARAPFERLSVMLYFIGGVSLVAFALAAFWVARNITRPLKNLTDAIDQIRAGHYDVTQKVTRDDELGVLAEGLALMQTAVQMRDQSIRTLAYQDSLTGLMNRTAFAAALGAAIGDKGKAIIGIVVINLQQFRRINEHLGYAVGDAVLTTMAKRIDEVPTVTGRVARLGADQFAAYTVLADDETLQAWGTSLLLALADPVMVEAQPIDITATIGLAQSDGSRASADALMRSAELALTRARKQKRALAIYEDTFKPIARDQLSLLGELRRAVENDEFRLYFQPKIDLATGRVAGAEVLLRWQHPTRGLLGPAEFIPFAEQTGFIRRLSRWTLDRAIAQGAEWQRAGKPLSLAVNVSADDIGDSRFDSRIAGFLTRHQLPPPLLTLEITESGFIADPTRALQLLNAISALGVSLSIDDFGTGYSSLSQLTRMPVHEMKIDRSFILGLESDAEFATVVRAAIDMGHGLGLKIVAEGIETEGAAARLREFGCDIAQGYLYAKPMSREHLEAWLVGRERVPVVAVPVDFTFEDVGDTLSLATY